MTDAKLYIVMEIGCIECKNESSVLGVALLRVAAWLATRALGCSLTFTSRMDDE